MATLITAPADWPEWAQALAGFGELLGICAAAGIVLGGVLWLFRAWDAPQSAKRHR